MGPATSSEEGIAALLDAGMNVARMNFSHGDHADHQVIYDRLRAGAASAGKALAVLADLQGPKIRLGRFADGPHGWATGDHVTITVTTSPAPGTGCPPPTRASRRTPDPVTGC